MVSKEPPRRSFLRFAIYPNMMSLIDTLLYTVNATFLLGDTVLFVNELILALFK